MPIRLTKPIPLTKKNLPELEANFAKDVQSGKKDRIFLDDDITGFGLRFRAGGKRTWVLQYKRGGRQTRLTIGPLSVIDPIEARAIAKRELGKVYQGDDPAARKRDARAKAKVTLRSVIDQYLAAKRSKLRQRSIREAERYLLHTWQSLHNWPIDKIVRKQVADIVTDLELSAPVAAGRARSNLSSLYKWAMGRGFVDLNPVVGTNNPDRRDARERTLTDKELASIWRACDDDDAGEYGTVIRLLILTGARRLEIGCLQWSEFDRDANSWTLPAARAKNRRALTLALPGMAWRIIDNVKRAD
jgi:Arm DNA-binding domain